MILVNVRARADDIICGDFNHGVVSITTLTGKRTNDDDDSRHGCSLGDEFLLFFLLSSQTTSLASGSPVHERTFHRPDPLQHFKDYNGGFDLRNNHYVASAAFTGVHGYAFACVWLLCGLVLAIFLIVKCLCGGSATLTSLDHYHLHIFFLLLFFTSLAIYVAHFVVLTVNLVTLVAAIVLMLLYWRPGFIIIIFCFWILTSLCWFLTGFDFFLHTFAEDACTAFEDFEKDPQNSSLGSMLPCMNESFSGKLIVQIGYTIHRFVVELNSNMSVIYRVLGVSAENEELLGVIKICDPFPGPSNLNYIPQSCPNNAIRIGDLSKILAKFTVTKRAQEKNAKKRGKVLPEASLQHGSCLQQIHPGFAGYLSRIANTVKMHSCEEQSC
ncbi:uncharacterized protein LOC124826325 [Vigna umbellata]|uniref:uncharacterized protein LOC124826325 n=1 Tax=Vigna umbellata TaxID=87088 RepID=UPI001F5FC1B8|nr:uncharacterized protein LOC124826325 [Vigna umbellata]